MFDDGWICECCEKQPAKHMAETGEALCPDCMDSYIENSEYEIEQEGPAMPNSFEKPVPCAKCGEPAEPWKYFRKIVSVVLHYCDRCGPRAEKQ